jgi:nicotinamide-nucleotide amidase
MKLYQHEGLRIATAESCTGGLIGGLLTSIPGASQVFHGGFITYTEEAKERILGIPKSLLKTYGAVSEPVVKAMAEATLERFPEVHVALSITGLAGPEGDGSGTPIGTVWFGYAIRKEISHAVCQIFEKGSRDDIRYSCLEEGLRLLESVRKKISNVSEKR